MAFSFSFSTLNNRCQLLSFSPCKCFKTPLHCSHSFLNPSPRHALTSKLSSFSLPNAPVTVANNNAVFTSLNYNRSTETLDYRGNCENCENSSDGLLLSSSNEHKAKYVKGKVDTGVVDNGKSTKNGARIKVGKRIDTGYENSSSNDERVERKVEGSIGLGMEGVDGHDSKDFGGDRSSKILLSKLGDDRRRVRMTEKLGNVGVENVGSKRELGYENIDDCVGRSYFGKRGDTRTKASFSKSSDYRRRARTEEKLGNVGVDNAGHSRRAMGYENSDNRGGRSYFEEVKDRRSKVLLSKSSDDRSMEEKLGDLGVKNVGHSRREMGYENIDNHGGSCNFSERDDKGNTVYLSKMSGDRGGRRVDENSGSVDKRRQIGSEKGGRKGTWSSSIWIKDDKSGGGGVSGDVRGIQESNSKICSKTVKKVKKEKSSKKNKVGSPEFQLRVGLDMCSKKGDVMGAISLYDSAVQQGVKMGQYQYTVLLYLCSSASTGVIRPAKSGSSIRSLDKVTSHDLEVLDDSEEENDDSDDEIEEDPRAKYQTEEPEVNEIRVSDEVKKYALERGFEVYEKMCLDKVQMNEASLTSVARLAMAMGNGDLAFDLVKQMKEMGINPKLRSYGPSLSVFSSSGEVDKAFAVEEHMSENNIQPEEPELEALLRASVQTRKADRIYYVLHKLRTNVRSVSPSTAELIEKWFKSKEASRVGKRKWDQSTITQTIEKGGGGWHGLGWLGTGKWSVARTSVGADGLCQCCGEKLALIDLDPEETDRFAESVASIAIKRDKNSNFQKFQRWLDYYGPFEAVVDAANVGLYSQRKFKASKVNAIVNGIRQMLPSRNWPLIILHNKRVAGIMMETPVNRAFVDKWTNADALYATPTGSNDDWYWLYAAIKFKGLLVTNDEMRDHTFQLLGNDFFPKWKERHQVRFSFSEIGPVFHMPPPCSVVIQESDKGKWHIPIASDHLCEGDRKWLCITRPKVLIGQQVTKVVAGSGEK